MATISENIPRAIIAGTLFLAVIICTSCRGGGRLPKGTGMIQSGADSILPDNEEEKSQAAWVLLVTPGKIKPGEHFRVVATGGKNIRKARIEVTGSSGTVGPVKGIYGEEVPCWRIDEFPPVPAGKYTVTLTSESNEKARIQFEISANGGEQQIAGKITRGWDSSAEALYSAWINSLFRDCDEQSLWPALHEVTRDRDRNFLYNFLSLGEDDPRSSTPLVMQPDCADNPFFLRAYFAWKLGLPFGYHICDRGWVNRSPRTGEWVIYQPGSQAGGQVAAFNSFLRRLKDHIHSGTARTALKDDKSDYYPVPLERTAMRPGVVYADPYGHTLVIVKWVPQTRSKPGQLLAVDAQPDGTVGIKRFWKGNFLFNTTEVVGEPGFKAFRPIEYDKGKTELLSNSRLSGESGFVPFSLQQEKMEPAVFYRAMERLINPRPLDPESALENLIDALHEQLQVRVTSVANGVAYTDSHPGAVIPMPSGTAAIFQSGGQWEDFSTPNRDLRLLIAMDAVLEFPERVAAAPADFIVPKSSSAQEIREKLSTLMEKRTSELSINYMRSDGTTQKLTLIEILQRREAFEMAYNPNDGPEIRWGAPENSPERASCRRRAPQSQAERMRAVRPWFSKRLHPPT